MRGNPLQAFPYVGGKNSKLKYILPALPVRRKYIEPCGGSLSVLLNRPVSPIEHANDLDEDVVNAWRVIRHRKEELIEQLRWTLYAYGEFQTAKNTDIDDDLERARRFWVSVDQGFSNKRNSTWRSESDTVHNQFREETEDMLERVRRRLRHVYFHSRPAWEIVEMKDAADAVIYVDPPYVQGARTSQALYNVEMSDDEQRRLAGALGNAKGAVVLSGYRNDLYEELYEGWETIDFGTHTGNTGRGARTETLWFNFKPQRLL